ncbi:MAG TPA: CDP-alcohol phosphatidyltransferase family protein [Stellaceae bacterium]|nr:CDP-alcohol phosphatidyltransferase family protein [Stellaceae bacterium]
MNLANLITLGRLLAVPLVVWLILSGDYVWTFWLFAAASVSDAIDGYVAKHFNQRTDLGALLDPIADKALIVSLFVTLGLAGDLPTWLVILVVFRDLLIIGGFLLAATLTQPIAWRPLMVSKVNTTLLLVLVTGMLAKLAFGFDDRGILTDLIYLAGVTTVASGAAYLVRWSRGVASPENESPEKEP